MTGLKTNERDGTRAVLRHFHMSATKARQVLDLIRGEDVNTAREILAGTTREAAEVIGKLLASAIANAMNNDGQSADELYVAAAFADDGPVMKRFSPRARGRSGRIGKRSTHITVIVARMDDDRIAIVRSARSAQAAASRGRRVASSRRRAEAEASLQDDINDSEMTDDGWDVDTESTDVDEADDADGVDGDEIVSSDTTEETDK